MCILMENTSFLYCVCVLYGRNETLFLQQPFFFVHFVKFFLTAPFNTSFVKTHSHLLQWLPPLLSLTHFSFKDRCLKLPSAVLWLIFIESLHQKNIL